MYKCIQFKRSLTNLACPEYQLKNVNKPLCLLQGHNAVTAVARILGCATSTITRSWTKYRQQVNFIFKCLPQHKCNISVKFVHCFLELPLKCRHCNIDTELSLNFCFKHFRSFTRIGGSQVTTQAQDNSMRTQHLRDMNRTAAQRDS